MGHVEEVLKIGKKLEKIISKKDGFGQAKDLLNTLKETPMTLEILQHTRIGLIVNNLRKNCSDEEILTASKNLVRSWKKLVELSKADDNGSSSSKKAKDSNDSSSSNSKIDSKKDTKLPPKPSVDRPKQTSFPSNTTNEVRVKCRQLLAEALKTDIEASVAGEELQDPEDLAAKIEDCIYKELKDTNMKYKNRIRSRTHNLKDKKNPDLRYNVLRGHIQPERIAIMTAEEMASNEMKEMRVRLTKEAINDHQMATTGGTSTELIKCPNCKKNNCTYNQVQTRSADEPMTTFCYCNECGKRWKFC